MTESVQPRFRRLAVPTEWVLGLAFVLRGSAAVRAAEPALRARWPSSDSIGGDLVRLTIEVLVLFAILRPISYAQSWQRALAALGLLLPWTFFNFVAGQHAGPVSTSHTFWLFWMVVGISGLTIMSFVASHGLRRSALFAVSVIGSASIAFLHCIEGATPSTWMAPTMRALMLLAVTVLAVSLLQRTHSRRG